MITKPPKEILYYGKDEALPKQTPLRAGPLSLIYEAGDLRYIKWGGREIVRRIYVAVRDRNWATITPRLCDQHTEIRRTPSASVMKWSTSKAPSISCGKAKSLETRAARSPFRWRCGAFDLPAQPHRLLRFASGPGMPGARCRVEQVDGAVTTGQFPASLLHRRLPKT